MQKNQQQAVEKPKISNVVATATIIVPGKQPGDKTTLNLDEIAKSGLNVTYKKKRFPAIIMRKTQPVKGTGLIFGTGKLVIIGVKSEDDAKKLPRFIVKDIQKMLQTKQKDNKDKENKITVNDVQIKNIVASCFIGYNIDLLRLSEDPDQGDLTTRHETFPGMVYKLHLPNKNLKLAALLFTSGKIVFTGAKSQNDLDHAFDYFVHSLPNFKRVVNNNQQQ